MHYWSTEDGCLDSRFKQSLGEEEVALPPAADASSLLSFYSRLPEQCIFLDDEPNLEFSIYGNTGGICFHSPLLPGRELN